MRWTIVLTSILTAVMFASGIYFSYRFVIRSPPERIRSREPEGVETAGRRFALAIVPRVARSVQERPVCVLGE